MSSSMSIGIYNKIKDSIFLYKIGFGVYIYLCDYKEKEYIEFLNLGTFDENGEEEVLQFYFSKFFYDGNRHENTRVFLYKERYSIIRELFKRTIVNRKGRGDTQSLVSLSESIIRKNKLKILDEL